MVNRYMQQACKVTVITLLFLMISGCLYPQDQRNELQVVSKDQIFLVQNAIEQYQLDTGGLLPIKNSGQNTPIYEKYVIDFRKLKERHYISQIPTSAYENGGTSFYVLIDVEHNPQVKLMDITTMQKVGDIQAMVDRYMASHAGELPSGITSSSGFYTIDYAKLGKKQEQVKSVYSGQFLGFIMDESGEIFVDYAPEIMKLINKLELSHINPQIDLRQYLVEESIFVPAKSTPYYWLNEGPTMKAPLP